MVARRAQIEIRALLALEARAAEVLYVAAVTNYALVGGLFVLLLVDASRISQDMIAHKSIVAEPHRFKVVGNSSSSSSRGRKKDV
jgi:hypothetical protein